MAGRLPTHGPGHAGSWPRCCRRLTHGPCGHRACRLPGIGPAGLGPPVMQSAFNLHRTDPCYFTISIAWPGCIACAASPFRTLYPEAPRISWRKRQHQGRVSGGLRAAGFPLPEERRSGRSNDLSIDPVFSGSDRRLQRGRACSFFRDERGQSLDAAARPPHGRAVIPGMRRHLGDLIRTAGQSLPPGSVGGRFPPGIGLCNHPAHGSHGQARRSSGSHRARIT